MRWCEQEGVLNTTVTLTGSSQVALARNPRPRANTAVARRAPPPQMTSIRSAGDPVVSRRSSAAPQPPLQRADDGYIYPADGSSNEARYPAPPAAAASTTPKPIQQQQQYYGNRGYAPAPQGYYQQRPANQPRGCYYQD